MNNMPNATTRPSRLRTRLKPLIFLTHLALTASLAGALPTLAHAQASHHYDIPAGPLDAALNRFAVQAGVALAIDAEKLKDLHSEGLTGDYAIDAGFAALLRNSGYGVARTAAGYILVALPKNGATPGGNPREAQLAPVLVVDRHESAGTTHIDRPTMDALGRGNGDISSILRVLPNVQFNDAQLANGSQGEISPADISINGAKYYQNLYQLDGMSINNDIDPVANNPNANSNPPSAAQGFAIDASLLCKLTLRDANISAEYGGFSGGVISAETCAPQRDFGGSVSLGTTRSSWMKAKIAPAQETDYANSTSQDTAKRFEKWTYRLALEGRPSENLGLIGSFVRRTSSIPLRGYANGASSATDSNNKEETRQTDNWFVKAFWTPTRDTSADLSFQYAPTEDEHFIANARNSFFRLESGGIGINANLSTRFDKFTLSHRLSSTDMQSSRESDENVWKFWRYSAADKNWGIQTSATTWNSGEGGWGNVEQRQKTLDYAVKSEFNPFALLGTEHRFTIGMELTDKEWQYNRKTAYEQYQVAAEYTGADCARADSSIDPYCSTADTVATGATAATRAWDGQYLRQRIIYKAGKFTVDDTSRAFFLEDSIKFGNFTARLGGRYEHSNLAPESTLAPRTAFLYDVFGNDATRLEAGLNRYYGRNFATFHMLRNRLSLQSSSQLRNGLEDWADPVFGNTAGMYNIQDLKVPYDDEKMLAVKQKWAGFLWGAKYVERKSRDQVTLHLRGSGDYWYDNIGRSDAESWSLTAETLKPLKLWGSHTSITVGVDQTKVDSTHTDYSDTVSYQYGTNPLDQMIVYEGKLMRAIDRPADNYARPWSARILFATEIPAANLTIANFLRYRAGFEKVVNLNQSIRIDGDLYPQYAKREFGSAITWDLQINYTFPALGTYKPYLALSVDNVLNRTNVSENTGDYMIYEKGRQYWLELGMKF